LDPRDWKKYIDADEAQILFRYSHQKPCRKIPCKSDRFGDERKRAQKWEERNERWNLIRKFNQSRKHMANRKGNKM